MNIAHLAAVPAAPGTPQLGDGAGVQRAAQKGVVVVAFGFPRGFGFLGAALRHPDIGGRGQAGPLAGGAQPVDEVLHPAAGFLKAGGQILRRVGQGQQPVPRAEVGVHQLHQVAAAVLAVEPLLHKAGRVPPFAARAPVDALDGDGHNVHLLVSFSAAPADLAHKTAHRVPPFPVFNRLPAGC